MAVPTHPPCPGVMAAWSPCTRHQGQGPLVTERGHHGQGAALLCPQETPQPGASAGEEGGPSWKESDPLPELDAPAGRGPSGPAVGTAAKSAG